MKDTEINSIELIFDLSKRLEKAIGKLYMYSLLFGDYPLLKTLDEFKEECENMKRFTACVDKLLEVEED